MAKRSFDIIFSVIGLVIFSPLLLVVGLLILVTLGWPVLYSAKRTGTSNSLFTMRKFRSMKITDGPTTHHSGDDDPRITTIGKWIRKFKLDELPQLLNIAKGEMSFVGPRPESPDYTKLYTEKQLAILELRPGITDFASIEFSDLGSILIGDDPDKIYFEKVWDRKMELRMKYVRERSFYVDLKLIFLTLIAIYKRKR
ncbi:MAG: sugar transferase [Chloroflexota bacterium]|nr:sugar transferase [Chloroflexota bacterium]